MRRASYKRAIAWIAANDSAGDDLTQEDASALVTAALVAEMFEVDSDKVGRDIIRARNLMASWDEAATFQENR